MGLALVHFQIYWLLRRGLDYIVLTAAAFELRIETKVSFRRAVIRSGIRRTVVQLYDGSKTMLLMHQIKGCVSYK